MANDLLIAAIRESGLDIVDVAEIAGVDPEPSSGGLADASRTPATAPSSRMRSESRSRTCGRRPAARAAAPRSARSSPRSRAAATPTRPTGARCSAPPSGRSTCSATRSSTSPRRGRSTSCWRPRRRDGCQIRIALADPAGPAAVAADQQQRPPGRLVARIQSSHQRLRALAGEPGDRAARAPARHHPHDPALRRADAPHHPPVRHPGLPGAAAAAAPRARLRALRPVRQALRRRLADRAADRRRARRDGRRRDAVRPPSATSSSTSSTTSGAPAADARARAPSDDRQPSGPRTPTDPGNPGTATSQPHHHPTIIPSLQISGTPFEPPTPRTPPHLPAFVADPGRDEVRAGSATKAGTSSENPRTVANRRANTPAAAAGAVHRRAGVRRCRADGNELRRQRPPELPAQR